MKEILLTRGHKAIVDDDKYDLLSQWKWYELNGYAVRGVWKNKKTKLIRMHRLILNTPAGFDTDHVNGDRFDNRIENLRVATRSQNIMNTIIRKDNTSGFKGVTWHKCKKKWVSHIGFKKEFIHLGYFTDKIEAAKAYDSKAKELHGEFASLNFPNL